MLLERLTVYADGGRHVAPVCHRDLGAKIEPYGCQAERLGIKVQFHGPTDAADLFYRAADVFVLPSGDDRTNSYEGLSVALIEAMSVGLVPIVTRGPGNEVLVKDGVTGLSFGVGDKEALVERLDAVIGDRELREAIGRAAHAGVRQDFSSSSVARKTMDLYQSL